MKQTILFLGFVLMLAQVGIAQKSNKKSKKTAPKDFIINQSQDTIWGQITGNLTPAITSVRITFIDDKTGTKAVYKAGEINSWHPGGLDYYFESKEYRPNGLKKEEKGYSVFMKRMTPYDGTVKLYEYYNTDGQEGYTQTFLNRRGVLTEVNYDKFYKDLAEYFSDYIDLANKIKEKKYKKTDLRKIVDECNLWKSKKV